MSTKKLTPEEIERGLTHTSEHVRIHFAITENFTPSSVQLARGLKDPSPAVRQIFNLHKEDLRKPQP